MERRKFIQTSAIASTLSALPAGIMAMNETSLSDIIKPKKLNKGDSIGLITPASAVTREAFEKTIANLENFGFKVKYSENMRVKKGFLAGTD